MDYIPHAFLDLLLQITYEVQVDLATHAVRPDLSVAAQCVGMRLLTSRAPRFRDLESSVAGHCWRGAAGASLGQDRGGFEMRWTRGGQLVIEDGVGLS